MFKLNPATKLQFNQFKPNNSAAGYSYEKRIVDTIIKRFGGRAATIDEQLQLGIDYISDTGESVDVKHQPRAYIHGTINIELLEYSTNNPDVNIFGSWYHSQADLYHWCIRDDEVEDVVIFNKKSLAPYIDRVVQGESIVGFLISHSNSERAKNESRKHGSAKYDNSLTCRVDIHILKQIQRDFELKEAGIIF